MKSGNEIVFECKEIKGEKNGFGNLVKLNIIHGDAGIRFFYLNLDQVEGITFEDI